MFSSVYPNESGQEGDQPVHPLHTVGYVSADGVAAIDSAKEFWIMIYDSAQVQ